MLIESIPGEPFSFHVIPFDNPRLQYTLQVRYFITNNEFKYAFVKIYLYLTRSIVCVSGTQSRTKERMDLTNKESDVREL